MRPKNQIFDGSEKAVLVSGGSRGLGREIARQFLIAGARVVIGGQTLAEVEAAAAELDSSFTAGRVFCFAGDISYSEVAQALIEKAISTFGRIVHLVSNIGIDVIKPALEYSSDEWSKIITVNLGGCFHVSISITSSIAGSVRIPTLAPYASSKGGHQSARKNSGDGMGAAGNSGKCRRSRLYR